MLVSSNGYLNKANGCANADIKKARVMPYTNRYLNDLNGQSFAKNMDINAVKKSSDSLVGKFLNLFA